jgi:hypothetical protein
LFSIFIVAFAVQFVLSAQHKTGVRLSLDCGEHDSSLVLYVCGEYGARRIGWPLTFRDEATDSQVMDPLGKPVRPLSTIEKDHWYRQNLMIDSGLYAGSAIILTGLTSVIVRKKK